MMLSWNDVFFGHGGSGRIYVTSPTFGVDLSVDNVEAHFSEKTDYLESPGCVGVRTRAYLPLETSYELKLKFRMSGLQLHLPTKLSHGREIYDYEGRAYLLDHGLPSAPHFPLWLPPGAWKCCYCDTLQGEALLQCRNCGATRFGVTK